MELRRMYLVLIFIIPSILGESLYYKVPKDHDPTKEIRGNSFGLENFLLQAYKEADTVNVNENVPVKRFREKETYRKPESTNDRGQTYGLEMLTPNLYSFDHAALGLSQYISSDFKPVVEPQQEIPKRRIPDIPIEKHNDQDERRERNKTRKPVKQIVRRPVSKTKASSNTTQRTVEFENFQFQQEEQEHNQNQEALINETVAEASYAVAKTQEIPVSEKETDDGTKQRPRKRVTMRRRRKRPQSSQNVNNNTQVNDASSLNDGNEAYEIQKEPDFVPAQTTTTTTTTSTTTTTIRPRTDKERPSRRKPGGFRKTPVEDVDPTQEIKVEFTTDQYRNDSEVNETTSPTIYTQEASESNEQPSQKLTTTTNKSTTTTTTTTTTTAVSITSSEETSAADLKTFLKQQNGPLSLSELLQTQNLSLAEFLKNRKEAALILSGRRGGQSTSPRPDSREGRPNFNKKNKSFSKHRQETNDDDEEESKSTERNKSVEVTTVAMDKYTYNGFVPKNPRSRQGQGKEQQTNKPNYGSEEKSTEKRTFTKAPDRHTTEPLSKRVDTSEVSNITRGEVRGIPKRFNDMRLKLRIHRRKYNPHSTTKGIGKEEKTEPNTISTTTLSTSSTPIFGEKPTTTEEITTTKRIGLRIPFKSSNNPELSLILPNKNKTEEKPEKRERFSSYASRVHGFKKSNQEKQEIKESNNLEQSTTAKNNDIIKSIETFPLDAIDFDDDKDILLETQVIQPVDMLKEEKNKSNENKRVDAVGKIPLPNEVTKYEQKDEILELLKPGSTSERLQRILESRNMTVKELLENREKSSQHANFTQLFQENDTYSKRNDLRTTTTADPNFKIFQSLPDFEPIHRNLFHKNVKEVNSNSYADSQIEESQSKQIQTRVNMSTIDSRGSKQFNGVLEVKKKLQLNSDSESRDTSLESNDGVIDTWNTRDKILFYNNAFTKPKEKLSTVSPTAVKFPINNRDENEIAETDIILLETIRRSQEENQKLKSNINEILQEQSEVRELNNDIDKSFIPPAVKSAIIASGIVMGLALFVFVAIFATCGWKQRQIRLRARSSILNDALAKSDSGKKIQRTSAISPVNYNQSSLYKKTLEMDDESSTSASLSSNASSYLWNTLKNTFTGRSTTLKNRLDKEEKMRDERLEGLKSVLRNQENRRSDLLVEDEINEECFSNPVRRQEGRYSLRKNDCVKSPSFTGSGHFSNCTHGH